MVEKLILGTVQLGMSYGVNNSAGMPSESEAEAILGACWENKLRILDTADSYGSSQKVIGSYFRKNQEQKFKVISKFSLSNEETMSIKPRLESTLKTLGLSFVDGYLFHKANDFLNSEARKAVFQLRKEGVIKEIGVSVYDSAEAERVLEIGNVDIIQMPFNLLDNWNRRGKIISRAKSLGVSVHVRSIFLQGLFFKTSENLPTKLKPIALALQRIQSIAKKLNVGVEELALRYALSFPEIDHVLIGVERQAQLNKNLACLKGPLSFETVSEINKIEVIDPNLLDPRFWT